jgi:quercetin dioxygenase-like cupin family protein
MKVIRKRCVFEDERGKITDILENEIIEHVTFISSKKGAVRGDHYHKESLQYTFVLKGSLKLLTQMPREGIQTKVVKSGDLIFTPSMEKHALIALEDSEVLVLTRGPRGGRNYEKDTYRLRKSESLTLKSREGIYENKNSSI